MSALLTDHDLRTEPVTKPPTRWRNWFAVLTVHYNPRFGWVKPGDEIHSAAVYPSREVARQRAFDARDAGVARGFPCAWSLGWVDYLGAYPEGERP